MRNCYYSIWRKVEFNYLLMSHVPWNFFSLGGAEMYTPQVKKKTNKQKHETTATFFVVTYMQISSRIASMYHFYIISALWLTIIYFFSKTNWPISPFDTFQCDALRTLLVWPLWREVALNEKELPASLPNRIQILLHYESNSPLLCL